ncbi:hypothetical protein [Mucilaginibacter psychrotolerans]|uniref:Uncharacterized protein n=1 Tax=Mucilaginibacter psychrotolerans TaxID=1524096 RepID=A0A4Y8SP19_9SPHI|nr:hypothetical protein [Mucilaginibacter psychrotolerans]TFF40642.1 hypothetical protein E2R66_00205 [Mucilaginibacter psychrotolerans]
MTYTREELLKAHSLPKGRFQEITQTLINKLVAKEVLTLAESKFICLGLRGLHAYDPNAPKLTAEGFDQCSDFLFWQKYLLYWQDHDGWGVIREANTIIPPSQKRIDSDFLHTHFEQWLNIIEGQKFASEILQTISSETNRLIKELVKYSRDSGEGSNRHKYIKKALVLHSKYLYLQIKEYYEEGNALEERLNLCGNLVVIDSFVYIHTLFGHFAESVKFNRPGKTYHRNTAVDFRNIPKEVFFILETYSKSIDCQYFNKQFIFLNLKGIDYAIWFRSLNKSLKGGGVQNYLRVQTYYPVELLDDRSKINTLILTKVNDELGFYTAPSSQTSV